MHEMLEDSLPHDCKLAANKQKGVLAAFLRRLRMADKPVMMRC